MFDPALCGVTLQIGPALQATPANPAKISSTREVDDEDEADDEEQADIAMSTKPTRNAIPRNVFGRAEDEITSDFSLPGTQADRAELALSAGTRSEGAEFASGLGSDRARPRASEPPAEHSSRPAATTGPIWQPLSDDEATGEALLSSLRRPENSSDGEPEPGGPGLN